MYMIVQLCVLKISRKWNFYYWRNEFLKIQYSSEVDGQRTCKTFARQSLCLECVIQRSQLAFFCTVSEFLVSKCRRQNIESTFSNLNNERMRWLPFQRNVETTFHDSTNISYNMFAKVFKMWTINLMHFFSGWCKIPTWDRESFVLRI